MVSTMLLLVCSTCRTRQNLKKRKGHSYCSKRKKARVRPATSLEARLLVQPMRAWDLWEIINKSVMRPQTSCRIWITMTLRRCHPMKEWTNAICLIWISRHYPCTSPEIQLVPLQLWNLATLNQGNRNKTSTTALTLTKTSAIHALKMWGPRSKSSSQGKTPTRTKGDLARYPNSLPLKTNSDFQPLPNSKMPTKFQPSVWAHTAPLSPYTCLENQLATSRQHFSRSHISTKYQSSMLKMYHAQHKTIASASVLTLLRSVIR